MTTRCGDGEAATGARAAKTYLVAMESKRGDVAWGIGLTAPVLVALGQTGFLFEVDLVFGAAILVAGALVAGLLLGDRVALRALYALAFLVIAAGVMAATIWYTADRSTILNYEMLIPMAIGCVPGVLLYLAVKKSLGAARAA